MESSGDARDLLARLRLLALETSTVVGQLALRGGGELVARDGLVTLGRAGAILGLSGRTVSRAVASGALHGERVEATGGVELVVVAKSDLHRWAAERAKRKAARRG